MQQRLHLLQQLSTLLFSYVTNTGNINIGSGATLHVGSLTATSVLAAGDWFNLKVLQLDQQASDIDFSGAVSLTTLRYTGKKITPVAEGSQSNIVTITGANTKLKDAFPHMMERKS